MSVLDARLVGDDAKLVLLRLLQAGIRIGPDRARVDHARAQHQPEEVVANVVALADRSPPDPLLATLVGVSPSNDQAHGGRDPLKRPHVRPQDRLVQHEEQRNEVQGLRVPLLEDIAPAQTPIALGQNIQEQALVGDVHLGVDVRRG